MTEDSQNYKRVSPKKTHQIINFMLDTNSVPHKKDDLKYVARAIDDKLLSIKMLKTEAKLSLTLEIKNIPNIVLDHETNYHENNSINDIMLEYYDHPNFNYMTEIMKNISIEHDNKKNAVSIIIKFLAVLERTYLKNDHKKGRFERM